MIKITATDAGFFNLNPVGHVLAPNVLLRTKVNPMGLVLGMPAGWQSAESARYDGHGIDVSVLDAPPETAPLGSIDAVTVSAVSFYREGADAPLMTGVLTLPKPLTITARFDLWGAAAAPVWQAELGVALEAMI